MLWPCVVLCWFCCVVLIEVVCDLCCVVRCVLRWCCFALFLLFLCCFVFCFVVFFVFFCVLLCFAVLCVLRWWWRSCFTSLNRCVGENGAGTQGRQRSINHDLAWDYDPHGDHYWCDYDVYNHHDDVPPR